MHSTVCVGSESSRSQMIEKKASRLFQVNENQVVVSSKYSRLAQAVLTGAICDKY